MAAPVAAVPDLVGRFGDDRGDAPSSQVRAVSSGRVGLVPAQRLGAGARPAGSDSGNLQLGEQSGQRWGVPGLAGCHGDDQRQTSTVDQGVGLGRQPAAGPPDRVVGRLVDPSAPILVIRPGPLCGTSARRDPRSGRAVLVDPGDRGVHADPPIDLAPGIGLDLQRREDRVPGAVRGEPVVALPHGLPRPEHLGQVPPRDPGPVPLDRPLDQRPMLTHRPTHRPLHRRKQRLNPSPHLITEHTRTSHPRSIRQNPFISILVVAPGCARYRVNPHGWYDPWSECPTGGDHRPLREEAWGRPEPASPGVDKARTCVGVALLDDETFDPRQ